MPVTHEINLNLSKYISPPTVHMMQGDTDSRIVVATIWDDSIKYTPPNGVKPVVRFGKPDGTGGLYNRTETDERVVISGDKVTAPIARQVLTVPGIVKMQIELYEGDTRISAFPFQIHVVPSSKPNAEEISKEYANFSINYEILGRYPTLAQLTAAHPSGKAGDAWFVGSETENVVYQWDTDQKKWVNVGSLKERGTGWWETTANTPQNGSFSSMSTLYAAYKIGDFLINPILGYVYKVTDVTVGNNNSSISYEYKGALGNQIASSDIAGIVKPNSDFDIAEDGTLSLYKEIAIEALMLNKALVWEMGSSVTGLEAMWALNKTPITQTITVPGAVGSEDTVIIENIGADVRSTTALNDYAAELWSGVKGQTRTNFFTLALSVKDARGVAASKSVSIQWFNGVYTGAAVGEIVDGIFLRSELTKSLQSSRAKTFTVNAAAGEYIWYACPVRYGTPAFNVGGFDGGFSKVKTFDFTNASNYTEAYQVWRSDNPGLGNTTVKVS